MHVVLGVVPSGKGRKGLGPPGVAIVPARFSMRERDPGTQRPRPPSPDPTWRAAGALFSCSLHLRYLIRGSTHPPPTWLQAHLRLRSAGPAGLRAFSHLHLSLCRLAHQASLTNRVPHCRGSVSSPLVSAPVCDARGPRSSHRCDTVPDGLATRGPANTVINHHTHLHTHGHTHTKRKAIIEGRRMLGA